MATANNALSIMKTLLDYGFNNQWILESISGLEAL
jgi:hypothetical protein